MGNIIRPENRSLWFNDVLYTAGTSDVKEFSLEFRTSDGTIAGTNLIKNLIENEENFDSNHIVEHNGSSRYERRFYLKKC